MMPVADGPSALPLWINGRAFLTMTEHFQTVQNPQNGQALRQLPMCGEHELKLAIESCQSASSDWQTQFQTLCQPVFASAAELLEKFSKHFCKMLTEETSQTEEQASSQIQAALSHLRSQQSASAPAQTPLAYVLMDASEPFAKPLHSILQALSQGQCVVIKTSPKAPAALFALTELFARAGLPSGVMNLLHGDEALVNAIAQSPVSATIHFSGQAETAGKIGAILSSFQKTLQLH